MELIGEVVEIGTLDGCDGGIGVVIDCGERFVTVVGLTEDEVRSCKDCFMSVTKLTIELA